MEYSNELYIDVDVKGKNYRITVKHADTPCDGEISVDETAIKTKLKTLKDGGAYIFSIDDTEVIITVAKDGDDFAYDCFVGGKSVQNDMPWKIDNMDYPSMTRWQKQRKIGKTRYILSETIKGALIGCFLFFILYFFDRFSGYDLYDVSLIYLVFTILPLAVLYAVLSPIDWNRCEKNYSKFEEFLDR